MSKLMQLKILKDRPTMFRVGGNDKRVGDCSSLFYVCYGHVQTFQNLGGPNALLAPSNENLGGPVPLVSTGSGPHDLHCITSLIFFDEVCTSALFAEFILATAT